MAMTLDEMLALLPDNTTGEIGADDLRTIVTEIWNGFVAANGRVSALEQETGHATVNDAWQLDAGAGAVPANGEISCDTGVYNAATWLRVATDASNGKDYANVLMAATSLYLQEQSAADNWVRYSVASPTRTANYVQFAVTVLGSAGSLPLELPPQTVGVLMIGVPTT